MDIEQPEQLPEVVGVWDVLSLGQRATSLFHLVDPASSHMLVSKIKPCMAEIKLIFGEAANGSLYQL